MSIEKLDLVVRTTIQEISKEEVEIGKKEVQEPNGERAWNMNDRLNMIAYEDQK